MNFPANPGVGDQYTFGTRTWAFNGDGWALVRSAGQVSRSFYLLSPLVLETAESIPVEVSNDFALVNYV